ncbi:MAG: glycosyltransferase family 2 protein [Chitinophagaceae bacterium]
MQSALPKISVITPSFNQGRFIEQTILSVIAQKYPNTEYIIMDGGSTDNTVDVIKKYEEHITYWQSQKDNGQAAAINDGFKKATGEILCWLNSDDMYMEDVFDRVAQKFKEKENPSIVFGNCHHFTEGGGKTRGSDVVKSFGKYKLSLCDYVIQPSSFWNRQTWDTVGQLDESLTYTFDWDWFIRAQAKGTEFVPVEDYLSQYRIHDAHKSGSGDKKRTEELKSIVAKYNDKKLSEAFNKWITLYNKNNLLSKTIDAGQRLNFSIINAMSRMLLFPGLSKKEYLNIVAMN